MNDDADAVVRRFHELYYERRATTWQDTRWLGTPVLKCPFDLFVYQELLSELRPDVVVETGTYMGGSALYLASIMDLLGTGRIITVDVTHRAPPPEHPRVTYLLGSSVADEIVTAVHDAIGPDERVLVILDSAHSAAHVLAELRAYAPLVDPGGYVIVEDTNVNGNPVLPGYGPGPQDAVAAFLAEGAGFEVDRSREKHLLSFNAGGFLRRTRAASPASP